MNQKLFDLQKKLQDLYGHDFKNMSIEEKEQHTKDTVLYLLEETHELLREVNFKTYKKNRKPVNIDKIHLEIIDIYCFLTNLCLLWDLPPDKFEQKFLEKHAVNVARISDKNY